MKYNATLGGISRKHRRSYQAWWSMIDRCTNPKSPEWKSYGGRGIKVFNGWRNSFGCFLTDMGEPPAGMSLDRIDNDGDYEPGNCHWASRQQQAANRRSSNLIEINGVTKCVADWARQHGVNPKLAQLRVWRGWNPIKAVTCPARS